MAGSFIMTVAVSVHQNRPTAVSRSQLEHQLPACPKACQLPVAASLVRFCSRERENRLASILPSPSRNSRRARNKIDSTAFSVIANRSAIWRTLKSSMYFHSRTSRYCSGQIVHHSPHRQTLLIDLFQARWLRRRRNARERSRLIDQMLDSCRGAKMVSATYWRPPFAATRSDTGFHRPGRRRLSAAPIPIH